MVLIYKDGVNKKCLCKVPQTKTIGLQFGQNW
jgi:hypothetical protein